MGSAWRTAERVATPGPLRQPPERIAEHPERPLGLYIHIPFCAKKCPYCDFNTYAGLDALFDDLIQALCLEMARWRAPLAGRTIHTVFLGGGTPTILDEPQLNRLFAAVHDSFTLADDCEITSEANPGTVDRAKFAALHSLGVNRLSLGVQSFQAEELRFLGRFHGVADVYRAIEAARQAGFDNLNLDFMFGLPHQPLAAWLNTLEQALALAPEHLSLYSLIVEPGTPLNHWVQRGLINAPDDDLAGEHYEAAMAKLAAAGYVHYEVSNWARNDNADPAVTLPEDGLRAGMPSLACRHNLIYWRNQEYLGVGPGAHSHLRTPIPQMDIPAMQTLQEVVETGRVGLRWGNRKPVQSYIKRIVHRQPVMDFAEGITPTLAMGESMMLGLRLVHEGVPFAHFAAQHGADLRDIFSAELTRLRQAGLLEVDGDRVHLTRSGLLVGNQIFLQFLPDA